MIIFEKYPHIKEYIEYYSEELSFPEVKKLLETGVSSEIDAEILSKFIWSMVDKMHSDCDEEKKVLGMIDNSDIFPDIQYEITLHLKMKGYINIWHRIRDQENKQT